MRKIAMAFATGALVMSLGVLGGCAGGATSAASSAPDGAPDPMPASHAGRFEDLGANGCYGCHGASETANPMLATATIVPEDHFAQGKYASLAFDSVREQCNTCHPQG
ncbi:MULTISPECIES: hypothetical protein [unclassified Adlercreutzia]|uniref:hypothetical protein n=1 Tax=unclassified Adlercreutzia TaxID=2636013 RepID=UPI0013EA34A5|nr:MULTISPECIES: hypothetical protein [unclassified Adlercreutzia]